MYFKGFVQIVSMKLHLVHCSLLKMIEHKYVEKGSVLIKLASNFGW